MSACQTESHIFGVKGSFTDDYRLLLDIASNHKCASHPLFSALEQVSITSLKAAALLRNYDAHAGVLRRLLLKAASIMPEDAACYVLENVRNEYGNGDPAKRHELQLLDLAKQAGVTEEQFRGARIQPAVKRFIRSVVPLYYPVKGSTPVGLSRPAIASGAITATEILAVQEFKSMQKAFAKMGLASHIWFDHVTVECSHTDDSLALTAYFVQKKGAYDAVEFGLRGVLDANQDLYDGLLTAYLST